MPNGARYALDWPAHGLRVTEPTTSEVRTHAALLATYYNEPTNRALLTNEQDFEADDVVEQFHGMWAAGDRPFLLFAGEELIGDCDLRNVEGEHAEYAVLVGPRGSQGKGLGTRFGTMVLALAFGPLAMRRVYAAVRPENKGSLRMFEKLGYASDASPEARRYAEESDDVCVSITRERGRALHEVAIGTVRIAVRE